jgi:DNA-binding response OmpR family regulator
VTEVLEGNGLTLCLGTRSVQRRGYSVKLGDIECRMLAALMRADGSPVSVPALSAELWGPQAPLTEARVRGVAKRLRSKLPTVRIETIVGEGYRMAGDC